MKSVLVIAPHPDDETLGAGGTILRHRDSGDEIFWLIVTSIHEGQGFSKESIHKRGMILKKVREHYGFKEVFDFRLPTTMLDTLSIKHIIEKIEQVFNQIKPNIIYIPFWNDVHTDHRIVFDAVYSCTKTFRYPFIKKVMMMEILSETDFAPPLSNSTFSPNVFVDISNYLNKKIEIMKIYEDQMGQHPFPRSEETICSLAYLRGSMAGVMAAEAFMLLKEIIR